MGDPIKTQAKITDSNTATSYTGPEKTFTINMAPSKSKHAGGGKNNVYLTEKHLLGFDKYKYSAVDTSPVSIYIMHPFWNAVVKMFPEWVAPNLLTFVGFLILVLSFIILSIVDWSYKASSRLHPQYETIPNVLFLLLGIGQFVAHTLDGIDGKQARRTNSSTPLGELFDHGSDSIIACLLPMGVYSIFGRSGDDFGANVWVLYLIVCVVMATFYISHWEKYLTGVMFLPWVYDVSQLTLALLYVVTSILGYEIWKGSHIFGFEFRYLFTLTVIGGSILSSIPTTVWNVYLSYRDGTGKNRSLYAALEPAISPTILLGTLTLWAALSPIAILQREPRLFCLTVGITMSNICCRLIISQMTDTKAETLNWLLSPVVGVAVVSLGFGIGETEVHLLYGLTALVVLAHVHFGVNVVSELADHFNIHVFSLVKRAPKSSRMTNGAKK
ncbi:ethanolaminephosphotransferase 1-like [Asterias rubens]|uniref:ethanolaminephosphotransferase 1-like n=1 Tax=Asterias rubens TaxID=7604 RepID=UPI0014556C1A|nr:ethanolaminephosphotransferase 1-like [Asterias rubens]